MKEFMISSLRTIMEMELANKISGDSHHLIINLTNGTKVTLYVRQLQ